MLIGVGQGAPRHRTANPHAVKLGGARTQANFDVSQALPVGQLGEGQTEKLIPAGEAMRFVVTTVSLNDPAKCLRVNPLHELGKYHFRRLHPARIKEPHSCRSHTFHHFIQCLPITCIRSAARRLDATGSRNCKREIRPAGPLPFTRRLRSSRSALKSSRLPRASCTFCARSSGDRAGVF